MNSEKTHAIAMKVNQTNLLKSLRFSFTHQTTVFAELMQNARRAKASYIHFRFCPETQVLHVSDNGCGIESLETLLTVAESGWNAETIATEHPFGLGFLSALFACRHITVISKSGSLSVETDHILAFKPVSLNPVNDWDGITTITLAGVNLTTESIAIALKRYARGFPIHVLLNDEELPRAKALDSGLNFTSSAIGDIYLHGLDQPIGAHYEFDLYLQGLPIYCSCSYAKDVHIIHLDSAKFYARLPDRDKLVNEFDVIQQVKATLTQTIEKRLMQLKAEREPEDFVQFYPMMKHWHLLALLNDVPLVPVEVLTEMADYPVCDKEVFGDFEQAITKPLTRSAIEARGVVTIEDDIKQEGAARYLFAREHDFLIYDGKLDSGHWLQPLVRNLNDETLTIELINETHDSQFQGPWNWVTVSFCDRYRITLGNQSVEIVDDAFYQGQDQGDTIIMPKGEITAKVLTQISTYRNEFEGFQETCYETECDAFVAFIVANTTKEPAHALRRLLPDFCGCPSLYGKSFMLMLDERGKCLRL